MTKIRRRSLRVVRAVTLLGVIGLLSIPIVPAQSVGAIADRSAAGSHLAFPMAASATSLKIPDFFLVGAESTISFVCPTDMAVDGKVPSAVTADNLSDNVNVKASYDVIADGAVSFAPAATGVEVTVKWTPPAAVLAGTGLRIRAACAASIDVGAAGSFAEASTSVVVPANKFVGVRNAPTSAVQGGTVTFNVDCTRPVQGDFVMKDAAGKEVMDGVHNPDAFPGSAVVSESATGFDVKMKVPAGLVPGTYFTQFTCRFPTDVVPYWQTEEPSPSASSPLTPFQVTQAASVAATNLSIPKYFLVGAESTISFVCPADLAVDGKVPSAVTADNLSDKVNVKASYNLVADGAVSFASSANGVQVTVKWTPPPAVLADTGLRIRAACGGSFDVAVPGSFAEATAAAVLPANKFVRVRNAPISAVQGSKVTFNVDCTRPVYGTFVMKDAAGNNVMSSGEFFGDEVLGVDSLMPSATGFDVVATIPAGLAPNTYFTEFTCQQVTDVAPIWGFEEPSPLTSSPLTPFQVTTKRLPESL